MNDFNQIVIDTFGLEADKINDTMTAKDIANWDSMNHLIFIAELEKNYGIRFSMDEVFKADSLGLIKKMLQAKGVVI